MDNKQNVNPWWKEAVVYQIWPRSFKDGNGDGIGDLKGVYEKLEYIKNLGATAIWFSPLYVSPQKDYGYDIADYRDIAPEYGTLDDFKAVLDKAHSLGLRVIMDLVVNHTSDQHKWFQESRKGGDDNPYKDYYIWRKGRGKDGKKPPNNWTAMFPGPGWKYDEVRKEFYLHLFAVEQPDLNMDNPKVREEVKGIMQFWLDMGVDGFREDVITLISKKEGLPAGFPLMPAARGMEHYVNGPHIHEYLQEFKTVWGDKKYDAMTVGEAPMMKPKTALKYITPPNNDLNMMFHFQHMECDCIFLLWVRTRFRLKKLKKVYANWQNTLYGKGWNALYIENHDQPRIISRYGSEKFRVESGKLLATMYLGQGGTPFIFQGQEIGMLNIPIDKFEDYPDVSTHACRALFKKFGFKDEKLLKIANHAARDNARTPVQWGPGKNADFTTAEEPWFKINPNYTEINVESALNDPDSILNYYKKMLELRKKYPLFVYGDFKLYYKNHKKLFIYERSYEGKKALVCMNFSETDTKFKAPAGFDVDKADLIIANYPSDKADLTLKPYEARIYLI